MSPYFEIIGEIVDAIRSARPGGEKASSIIRRLTAAGLIEPFVANYLDAAFCLRGRGPSIALLPHNPDGSLVERIVDRDFDQLIEEFRPVWSKAGPYPDLMRRRDRHAFRAVARATDAILIVRAADRRAARYISAAGHSPAPPELPACARTTEPNRALMAADPDDPRLASFIAARFPGASYDDYRRELGELGFSISGPESGYVVRDAAGSVFYPGYYLLGAYGNSNHRNAWTGNDGERIRAALNRALGHDLAQWGPHDSAEARRGGRGGFDGPCFPALFFFPDGDVKTRVDLKGVASLYRYLEIDWDRLYAPKPAEVTR